MPRRKTMGRIKECFRLSYEAGLNQTQIARALSIGRSTVWDYLKKFEESGLSWEEASTWSEEELDIKLFTRPGPPASRVLPDFKYIHKELRRPGVTLQLLWEEYRRENSDGFGYSRFCVLYREWRKKLKIVVIAVEVLSPKGFGRIRMRRVPDVSGDSFVPFICDTAESGTEILTDGWGGYNSLSKHSYMHSRTVLLDSGDPAHVAMPGVHRIASLLKRWLLGIHQGAVSGKHLDYYLDEYTFRFNRRTSRSRGMLFYRLMQQAVATASVPYQQLVDAKHKM